MHRICPSVSSLEKKKKKENATKYAIICVCEIHQSETRQGDFHRNIFIFSNTEEYRVQPSRSETPGVSRHRALLSIIQNSWQRQML